MKKQRLVSLPSFRQLATSFILALSAAFAAEPGATIASAGPLIDALEAFTLIDNVAVSPAYIPGYGLQLNAAGAPSDSSAAADVIYPGQDIVTALSETRLGLEPRDWVSATLRHDYTAGDEINITVRVKPGESNPPELRIGGMLFNYPIIS